MDSTTTQDLTVQFHQSHTFSELLDLIDNSTPSINFFGKKYLGIVDASTKNTINVLAFSKILKKTNNITNSTMFSTQKRFIAKKLEQKLKEVNEILNNKIKNSNFLTRCFSYLSDFFAKLNPYSSIHFLEKGFKRLEYYTKLEWGAELPILSLPETPDCPSKNNTVPKYKKPKIANNSVIMLINKLGLSKVQLLNVTRIITFEACFVFSFYKISNKIASMTLPPYIQAMLKQMENNPT